MRKEAGGRSLIIWSRTRSCAQIEGASDGMSAVSRPAPTVKGRSAIHSECLNELSSVVRRTWELLASWYFGETGLKEVRSTFGSVKGLPVVGTRRSLCPGLSYLERLSATQVKHILTE